MEIPLMPGNALQFIVAARQAIGAPLLGSFGLAEYLLSDPVSPRP